jgi:hypothetical protein
MVSEDETSRGEGPPQSNYPYRGTGGRVQLAHVELQIRIKN